jgi:hypothetical protein
MNSELQYPPIKIDRAGLTPDQIKLGEVLDTFFAQKECRLFLMDGYAGTAKMYMTRQGGGQ